jgi:biopolymer transport protein ExbD
MGRLLSSFLLASLPCGCAPSTAPPTAAGGGAADGAPEPPDPRVVKLPVATGAKAVLHTAEYFLFLNVNDKGQVLIDPIFRPVGAGEGDYILENAGQMRTYLGDMARQARRAGRPPDEHEETGLVLRVDARTPFGKTYEVLKAGRAAGFTKYRWRALRAPDGDEGQFAVVTPTGSGPARHTARVTSDAAGTIAAIALDGAGLKAGVGTLLEKLRGLRAEHETGPVLIGLEIDERLLQRDVIRLIDAAVSAGFGSVRPVPADPKKR